MKINKYENNLPLYNPLYCALCTNMNTWDIHCICCIHLTVVRSVNMYVYQEQQQK